MNFVRARSSFAGGVGPGSPGRIVDVVLRLGAVLQ
jgi:hypothetical protein